jgi:hypothetical protein
VKRSEEGSSSRWLRLLIGAPVAVLGGVVLSVALGAGVANADESHDSRLGGSVGSLLGDATDLVGDVLGDTTSTVKTVTTSATEVVKTVVTPAKEKPVKHIVETVVNVVPATTDSVGTTVTNLLDNTSTTVETVTDEVLPSVVDTVTETVTDVTDPVLDDGVEIDLPGQLSPASDVVTAAPLAAATYSAGALVTSPAPTAALAAIMGGTNGNPVHFPAGPVPIGTAAPVSSAAGGSATGYAPVSTATYSAGFGLAGAGVSATPENDELPSTPTFDTDTSPD